MKSRLIHRLLQKEGPTVYQLKDGNLDPTLTTLDLIGLGTGMVVGTGLCRNRLGFTICRLCFFVDERAIW